jgi:hypothetical protein
MNKKNREKIEQKYPSLFSEKDYWDGCNDGWFFLIDFLCTKIIDYKEKNNKKNLKIEQIKQKFGAMRCYVNFGEEENIELYNIIRVVELMASKTCEFCGQFGKLKKVKNNWLVTSCDNCFKI